MEAPTEQSEPDEKFAKDLASPLFPPLPAAASAGPLPAPLGGAGAGRGWLNGTLPHWGRRHSGQVHQQQLWACYAVQVAVEAIACV